MGFVNKSFNDIMTFTRNSTATYTDPTGKIRTAGVNEPRFTFDPETGEPLGLLVEEQRTNLLTRSEDFTQSVWVKLAATVTASSVSSPILGQNYQFVSATATSTTTVGTTHNLTSYSNLSSVSFFAKPLGDVRFLMVVLQGVDARVTINLDTQAINPNAAAGSVSVSKLGERWFVNFPNISGVTGVRFFIKKDDAVGTTSSSFTAGEGLYLIGAQLEQASTPSSYIPTEASAVTRLADNVSRTLGAEWNPNEGSFHFKFSYLATPSRMLIDIGDGTNNNNIRLLNNSVGSALEFGYRNANVGSPSAATGITYVQGKVYSIVVTFKLGLVQVFEAGVLRLSVTTFPSVPPVTTLSFGSRADGSVLTRNSSINAVDYVYYPRALSQAEAQALTKI
jgi:hypothetical protein